MGRPTIARNLVSGFLLGFFVLSADISFATIQAEKVVVLKKEKRLVLLRNGEVLKSYSISLGRNPGKKLRRGDNRTPEGKYVVDRRNPRSRFYKALHISYPNSSDAFRASRAGVPPGGNILIHGLPEGFEDLGTSHSVRNWTNGCIAVSNAEMDEIWQLVPDGSPVEIRP